MSFQIEITLKNITKEEAIKITEMLVNVVDKDKLESSVLVDEYRKDIKEF